MLNGKCNIMENSLMVTPVNKEQSTKLGSKINANVHTFTDTATQRTNKSQCRGVVSNIDIDRRFTDRSKPITTSQADRMSVRSISSEDISADIEGKKCCSAAARNPAIKTVRRIQLLQVGRYELLSLLLFLCIPIKSSSI